MLILIKRFIMLNYWWVLLGSSLVSGFAGGYAVRTWYKASLANEYRVAVEKREANDEKARKVGVVVDRLPDGASAQRLFISWSRN